MKVLAFLVQSDHKYKGHWNLDHCDNHWDQPTQQMQLSLHPNLCHSNHPGHYCLHPSLIAHRGWAKILMLLTMPVSGRCTDSGLAFALPFPLVSWHFSLHFSYAVTWSIFMHSRRAGWLWPSLTSSILLEEAQWLHKRAVSPQTHSAFWTSQAVWD